VILLNYIDANYNIYYVQQDIIKIKIRKGMDV